jgi:hypothetical protein
MLVELQPKPEVLLDSVCSLHFSIPATPPHADRYVEVNLVGSSGREDLTVS